MPARVLRTLVLGLAAWFGDASTAIAQNILDTCRLNAQTDYMMVHGKDAANRPIVVIGPKGGRIEARLDCSWSPERWRLDPFKGGQTDAVRTRWEAPGGRYEPVANTRSERLYIPIKPGENVVPVTFRRLALQYGNRSYPEFSATQTIKFEAWVFETEVVGTLESPVGPLTGYEWSAYPQFMDDKRNIYVLFARADGQRTVLTRHDPRGRIAARYEIGPNREGGGTEWGGRLLIGVDTNGNAYGVVNGNFVQFDASGRFVRAIAAFGNRKLAGSVDDLADRMASYTQERDGPLAEISQVITPPGFAPLVSDNGFHVFVYGNAPPGTSATTAPMIFGRLGLDGQFSSLATVGNLSNFNPYRGPVSAPDGRFYTTFSHGNDYGLLVQERSGRVLKRVEGPSGSLFISGGMAGFDNDDGAYLAYGDGCERVKFSEMAAYAGGKVTDLQSGGTAMNSRMLNQRWDLSTSDRQPIRDMLTGQPVPAATDDRQMPGREACWVHDGSLYALWDDLTIGKFTFATAKGGPSKAAATAGPSLSIEPTAAVETGIVLDGRTKAEISVLLRDANNRPMPGVPVEIEIDDKELGGDRGALEVRNEVTDREGRVRATYLPPAVDTSRLTTLRFMPLGLAASAQPQGQKRLEASATLRGLPTSIAQLQGSHVGFEPSAAIPLPYRPDQDVVVQGRIIAKPKSQGFDSRFADTLGKEYAVAGATIEILGEDGKPAGSGTSDHTGAFQVTIRGKGGNSGKTTAEPVVLPEPIVLEEFTEPVRSRMRRVGDMLRVLEGSPYSYDTESLVRLMVETFPQRLAASRDAAAADREVDALDRVGLFAASVKVTQDLGQHAVDQSTDSLTSIVSGLFEIATDGDLLDKLKSKDAGSAGAESVGRWALDRDQARLVDLTPSQTLSLSVFTKLRVYILQKLLAVLSREEGRASVQTFYEVTVWSVAKDALTDFFSDATQWASDSSGWKAKLARPFTRHFHAVAQKGLGHIATAWRDNPLSGRTSLGPAMRALYADLAANKDQVSQKQLNYEIYKAQVDLGFDTLGNFAKIYAGLTAGPAGAEGTKRIVDGLETGYKLLNVGIDAYLGFLWLGDFEAGIAMLGELERLAVGGGA